MRGIVVGVIIVIILLIVWASVATNLLVVNLGKTDDNIAYNNNTIRDLKRMIDSGDVANSEIHRVLNQLESDFASQETALITCRNIKTQCGTDLSACVIEKSVCDQTLTQCTTENGTCTTEKGTCIGNLTQCTTEKGTCTGNLTQCTTEKGSCVSARATCDTNLIEANAEIVALQGQITTLGETPTTSTTTTSSSNTGQTIGITVAVTLVIVGAIWILIRRSSAKTTPAIGLGPPDKYRNRTSFSPSSLIPSTRKLFSRRLSALGADMQESDHLPPNPSLVRQDAAFFEPPAAPASPFLTWPTASGLENARNERETNSRLIGNDIANAAAKLTRINSALRV
ncbi:putative membrane protein [Emiliania huxleyi virus 145]|nr:putative membrane protein [Emiliania huxleyi virus 145]AHA55708.1 putative membrane protein [Emiliania huxleyi virus 164]